MDVLVAFMSRYLSPFTVGICAAAATIVDNVLMAVALLLAAALLCFFNLPVGGRMIRRVSEPFGKKEIAMTDVAEIAVTDFIEVAKVHQAWLVAEIAGMGDFIRMAENLVKNGEVYAEEERDPSLINLFADTAA
jgi:hypothetical protein